jgi:geranylgeranyl reductase family protein
MVVGAGPSGSVAAHAAAQAGLDVLLLEKSALPREKACGGAVMYRGLRILKGRLPRSLIERRIHGLRFRLSDVSMAEFVSDKLIGVTTSRAKFDEFLARRAEEAGAELLQNARVVGVTISDDEVQVHLHDGRAFRGKFVIGADGVNSIVSRSIGLRPERKDLTKVGLGMESDILVGEERVVEALDGNPSVLEISPAEGRVSYGWVFPKRASLAVGIAGAGVHMRPLRPLFDRFVRRLEARFGFALDVRRRRTSFLGADGVTNTNVADRVILVGDAAGFVDPMMGEGIAYAMKSGVFAVEILKDAIEQGRHDYGFLARYHKLCRDDFGASFSMAAWAGLRGLEFAQSVLTKASRIGFSSEVMASLARGDMGYSDIPYTVIKKLPTVVSTLLRGYVRSRHSSWQKGS